jgi:hypothetical protein
VLDAGEKYSSLSFADWWSEILFIYDLIVRFLDFNVSFLLYQIMKHILNFVIED